MNFTLVIIFNSSDFESNQIWYEQRAHHKNSKSYTQRSKIVVKRRKVIYKKEHWQNSKGYKNQPTWNRYFMFRIRIITFNRFIYPSKKRLVDFTPAELLVTISTPLHDEHHLLCCHLP